jgi:hypothetical protein
MPWGWMMDDKTLLAVKRALDGGEALAGRPPSVEAAFREAERRRLAKARALETVVFACLAAGVGAGLVLAAFLGLTVLVLGAQAAFAGAATVAAFFILRGRSAAAASAAQAAERRP